MIIFLLVSSAVWPKARGFDLTHV